jgi:hypothetical protein
MTADQLDRLAEALGEFIAWVLDTEDPPVDVAAFRWTQYVVQVSAKVLRDVTP